ncbi:MAG: hypothetical protein RL757_1326 [Bacteroidota bacterium]|jgi:type IX secretion system PorP/SprF family membrane protein
MLKARHFLFVLVCFVGTYAQAQDPVFSQFFAAPLQLNPAFAGNAQAPFIALNYRVQWPSFGADTEQPGYNTSSASYDQFIDNLNSGIGFTVMTDNQADIVKRTTAALHYAYRVKLNDYLTAKIGLQVGVFQSSLNWDKFIFQDQIDPLRGPVLRTAEERPLQLAQTKFDVGSGVMLYGETFHVGLNLSHLTTPNESFLIQTINGTTLGLPLRTTLHGGYTYVARKGTRRTAEVYISPTFLYTRQSTLNQLNVGSYAGFGPIFGGMWYRHTFGNPDALIMALGFRNPYFKFGYSFDFTVSNGLSGKTGGTHEVSLVFNLDPDAGKRKDLTDCFKMFR